MQVVGQDFALRRTLSPALVAQYQTQLPDKGMLAAKLHAFHALNATEGETPMPAARRRRRDAAR